MNCEKQICTICRLLVEVRANAADSQADLMLLAIPPQPPAISIQPFTPLRFWQHLKFIPRTEVFWIQQSHLFFSPKGANTPLPLPAPGPKAAFKWSQLRLAISIQAGELAAGGSGRDASARSLFIIRKACLLSGLGLLQCRRSWLRPRCRGPLWCSKALLVFSISGSFLSLGSRPGRGRKSSRLGAGTSSAHPGQTSPAG